MSRFHITLHYRVVVGSLTTSRFDLAHGSIIPKNSTDRAETIEWLDSGNRLGRQKSIGPSPAAAAATAMGQSLIGRTRVAMGLVIREPTIKTADGLRTCADKIITRIVTLTLFSAVLLQHATKACDHLPSRVCTYLYLFNIL